MCKGQTTIATPDNSLWQKCPMCDGTGEDPGVGRFMIYRTPAIALTANQLLTAQALGLGGSAPFRLMMLTRKSTGTFRFRFWDSTGQYFSSGGTGSSALDRIPDTCMFGDGSLPFVVAPHPLFPAAGTINYDIEDTSGGNNTVEICFVGELVYPTPTQ
jgi:hypothetical protein